MTTRLGRLLRATVALGLALGWTLSATPASAAVVGWGVSSPPAGTRLESPQTVQLLAFVDAHQADSVDSVELRFTQGGAQTGSARRMTFRNAEQISAGVQRTYWSATLDPMSAAWFGGEVAPNGHYQLQVRVHYRVQDVPQDPTAWSEGHALTIDVPPPVTSVQAAVANAAEKTVEVTWEPVGARLPDFTRYLVERASGDAAFNVVYETWTSSEGRYVDTLPAEPPDAQYRYRVKVHRRSADGGEHATTSQATAPITTPAEPSPSPSPSGSQSPDGATPSPQDGDTEGDTGAAAGTPGFDRRPRIVEGTARTPNAEEAEPPQPQPRADPPSVARAEPEGTYDPHLDYEIPEHEVVARREPVRDSSGRGLQVFGGQELQAEQVLVPLAGGLLFILAGVHVWRFVNPPRPRS